MVWRIWGEGEPLVIGHGAQGAWSHWIRNIEALAQHRMVIAPDLPGFGESALPSAETHEALSQALADGLEQVTGGRQPVDMAGFSFAASAFAWFARLHPERVRRLILVGAGGLDTPMGTVVLKRMAGVPLDEREAVLKFNLLGLMLHAEESVDDLALYLQQLNGKRSRLEPISFVLPDRLLAAVREITVPVDAIWGEFDQPHPTPAVQEKVLRAFQPDLDFRVIGDAGHWVMYERPEAFNTALLSMLERKPRPC